MINGVGLIQRKNVSEKEVWMSGKQGEWWRFVRWNAWGIARGMNLQLEGPKGINFLLFFPFFISFASVIVGSRRE